MGFVQQSRSAMPRQRSDTDAPGAQSSYIAQRTGGIKLVAPWWGPNIQGSGYNVSALSPGLNSDTAKNAPKSASGISGLVCGKYRVQIPERNRDRLVPEWPGPAS
jgi:hypothetical protein